MRPKPFPRVKAADYRRGMLGPDACSRIVKTHRGGSYSLCHGPVILGDECYHHCRAGEAYDALKGLCDFIGFTLAYWHSL